MNTWRWLVFALGCLAALGCRADPRIAALHQELRLYEDRIYELQDELEDTRAQLGSCRQENEAFRMGSVSGEGARESKSTETPVGKSFGPKTPREPAPAGRPETAKPPEPVAVPSRVDVTKPPESQLQQGVPKSLQRRMGGESAPERIERPKGAFDQLAPPAPGDQAPPFVPGTDGGAPLPLPGGAPPANNAPLDKGANGAPVDADPASARVGSIALGDLLTGAFDADGRPGDEGLSVFVQPRDAEGRLLGAPAPVSVVVIDPALSGEAARVARWDLSAQEIAAMYQKSGSAEGFHLELAWPDGVPAHDELRLHVRYTTADGRKLEAQRAIEVSPAPGGSLTARSSPSTPSWRAKQVVEQPAPPVVPSPRLETPPPPTRPGGAPVARTPQRPAWSPERR
jgi:hypothetical protein